jgi:hypothetical protein
MAKPSFSYDAGQRKAAWEQIPAEDKIIWNEKARHIIRSKGVVTVKGLARQLRIDLWKVYMLIAPLIDQGIVYVDTQDDQDRPVRLVCRDVWEARGA